MCGTFLDVLSIATLGGECRSAVAEPAIGGVSPFQLGALFLFSTGVAQWVDAGAKSQRYLLQRRLE